MEKSFALKFGFLPQQILWYCHFACLLCWMCNKFETKKKKQNKKKVKIKNEFYLLPSTLKSAFVCRITIAKKKEKKNRVHCCKNTYSFIWDFFNPRNNFIHICSKKISIFRSVREEWTKFFVQFFWKFLSKDYTYLLTQKKKFYKNFCKYSINSLSRKFSYIYIYFFVLLLLLCLHFLNTVSEV